MSDINTDFVKPVFPIVETAAGEFTHQIPETMHPGFIRGDGEANDRAKQALTFVMDELTKLNAGRVQLDPNHKSELARGFHEIGNAIGEARTVLKAEEKRLANDLADRTGFKVDPAMMALVVGTFQAMPAGEHPGGLCQTNVAGGSGRW